jgi:hypothetical protein
MDVGALTTQINQLAKQVSYMSNGKGKGKGYKGYSGKGYKGWSSKGKGKGKGYPSYSKGYKGKGKGWSPSNYNNKGKGKGDSGFQGYCGGCHEWGHKRKHCPKQLAQLT